MTILGGTFDYEGKVEQLIEVNRELESPEVWNDQERAQRAPDARFNPQEGIED